MRSMRTAATLRQALPTATKLVATHVAAFDDADDRQTRTDATVPRIATGQYNASAHV